MNSLLRNVIPVGLRASSSFCSHHHGAKMTFNNLHCSSLALYNKSLFNLNKEVKIGGEEMSHENTSAQVVEEENANIENKNRRL